MHWGAGLQLEELEASIEFCVLSWCSWAGGRDSYLLGWSFIVLIVSVLSTVAWPFVSVHLYLPFPFVGVALCVQVLGLSLWGGQSLRHFLVWLGHGGCIGSGSIFLWTGFCSSGRHDILSVRGVPFIWRL